MEKKSDVKIKVIKKIEPRIPKSEKEIAMEFALKVHEKFDRLIKASILFGSQAKDTATAKSDIDIILIVDDSSINWDLELVAWYREELSKLISSLDYGPDLHINTVKLTTWWEDLMSGDPVVINVIRYGEVLIDSGGFFNPIKALLIEGKIRSTPEAAYNALRRAPQHLLRSKIAKMSSIEGVYWTMVDSAQAALIVTGNLPPSPEHIPKLMKETFVDKKVLDMKYVRAMSDLYLLHKQISRGDIRAIKGEEIDKWQDLAQNFLSEMARIIDAILENKKETK